MTPRAFFYTNKAELLREVRPVGLLAKALTKYARAQAPARLGDITLGQKEPLIKNNPLEVLWQGANWTRDQHPQRKRGESTLSISLERFTGTK